MTVFIGKLSADLNIYKLDGAEELYFGTGEPGIGIGYVVTSKG